MRTSLMSFLVALALTCCGLEGPRGPQGEQGAQGPRGETGPAGPAGSSCDGGADDGELYGEREALYCRDAPGSTVECDDFNDLLITGGCSMEHVGMGVILIESRPHHRPELGFREGWDCAWDFVPGVLPLAISAFGGRSHICCVGVP